MSEMGLLQGLNAGLSKGLEGYVAERDRRDKRALAEQKFKSEQDELLAKAEERKILREKIAKEMQDKKDEKLYATQKDEMNALKDGFLPFPEGKQPKKGLLIAKLGNKTFAYDPEEQQRKKVQVSAAQATEKARIDAEKEKADYALGSKVPGYEMQEGFRPKLEDIGKFRTSKNVASNIKNLTSKIRDILETSGPQGLPGDAKGKLDQYITQLALQKKEADKLGVLAGPDLDLLMKQIGNSTSFADMIARGGYDSAKRQYLQNLTGLDEAADFALNTEAANLGFRPVAEKPAGLLAGANTQNAPAASPATQNPKSLAGVGTGSGVASEYQVGNKRYILNPKTGNYRESN